jgi:iron complex transport system substrate-binding protein
VGSGVVAILFLLALFPTTPVRALRVVSLNLCTDDYLVLLAPESVLALSPLATDPSGSVVAAAARRLPWVRPDAEAVLALRPDLVLGGPYGAQTTLAALARHGLRVERTGLPQDFPAIREETRRMAAVLGVPERGEAMLAHMDAELAAIPRRTPVRALYLEAGGHAAGAGTLEAAVLRAAGLDNAGAGGRPGLAARPGLEAILANPPQLLVVPEAARFPSLATELLRHPALSGIPRRSVPPALLACAGPWTAAAAALLAK